MRKIKHLVKDYKTLIFFNTYVKLNILIKPKLFDSTSSHSPDLEGIKVY